MNNIARMTRTVRANKFYYLVEVPITIGVVGGAITGAISGNKYAMRQLKHQSYRDHMEKYVDCVGFTCAGAVVGMTGGFLYGITWPFSISASIVYAKFVFDEEMKRAAAEPEPKDD